MTYGEVDWDNVCKGQHSASYMQPKLCPLVQLFRGQSQQLPLFWKVQCSESTLPLLAIALQLSAFRGERTDSSQLTLNPLAMSSAGNNTSL